MDINPSRMYRELLVKRTIDDYLASGAEVTINEMKDSKLVGSS
jgi:hypothetical protein